ncbi:MAG: leucyl/phenylalanyl-tRNA--protein transferase [Deltaproteobacteria bacterium RBG_13_49_15]|nr:MAG: leucyl/phenylalanyl-tRNA--protein transferase [Deltaproteobacteria bacterium RBG_13_49_15]
MPVFLLSDEIVFPSPLFAGENGLLAIGGDLSMERLLLAYRMGIFPWYSENEPILWWSPDPRLVLFPSRIHISRNLRRVLKKRMFQITMDSDFRGVITSCSRIRLEKGQETWIDRKMIEAYCALHEAGYAHSVEIRKDGQLCGGLYGVSLGGCFFGESMFSRIGNASKIALACLVQYLTTKSFIMIDCQTTTRHLVRMGAQHVPRSLFLSLLQKAMDLPNITSKWEYDSEMNPERSI